VAAGQQHSFKFAHSFGGLLDYKRLAYFAISRHGHNMGFFG
jgi:hypothetical protein